MWVRIRSEGQGAYGGVAKTLGDGDQILHQFLLWGELLLIEDHQLAVMGLTEMHNEPIGKASQTILMGQYHPFNLPVQNLIDQAQKLLALAHSSPAYFHDPFIDLDPLPLTILFEYASLMF
jgi:hypothetical protein